VDGGGPAPTLEVTSASVALGVVGGPSFGGVYRTADACELYADGSFRVLARVDRVIKRMGRQVDLEVVAQIVPRAGSASDPSAIAAALSARLAPWERPTRIELATSDELGLGKWSAAG